MKCRMCGMCEVESEVESEVERAECRAGSVKCRSWRVCSVKSSV